jgi:hypothetical protein
MPPATPSPGSTAPLTVHVVSNRSRAPLAGASITLDQGTGIETTTGVFAATCPTGYRSVGITRSGFLPRRVSVPVGGGYPGEVTLDLIDTSAPFDTQGYRDMLFDGQTQLGADFYKLRQSPLVRIYDTTPGGVPVPPALIGQVAATIAEGVPLWSGSTLTVRGTEVRSGSGAAELGTNDTILGGTTGVLTVQFQDELTIGGRRVVGVGWLQNFGLDSGFRVQLNAVLSPEITLSAAGRATVLHELGHAMGFLHHGMPVGALRQDPVGGISAVEADIARIAYARDSGLRWEDDMVGSPVISAAPLRSRPNPRRMVQP